MSDYLKRIEEKHRLMMMVEGGAYCEVCRRPDRGLPNFRLVPHPCPELKLARALDEILARWKRAESNRGCYSCAEYHDNRCATNWAKPEPCDCGRDELEAAATDAERTLEEVAGDD